MTHRAFALAMVAMASVATAILLAPIPAAGQTPAPNPWTAPRLPDGQPDMQGFWISQVPAGVVHSLEDGQDPENETLTGAVVDRNPIPIIVEPADGRLPYQPEAAARRNQLLADIFTPTKLEHVDPHARSLLDGLPRTNYVPGGLQIVQAPGYVLFLYESNHAFRVIPTDGRRHAGEAVQLWMGDSRGRWEGNTLVVDVTNFNTDTWLDAHGTFHSEALHLVERWTLAGPDRIEYEVTIEDPKVFARPWKMAFTVNRSKAKGQEFWEDSRLEGERDSDRILEGGRRAKEAGLTGIHEHRRDTTHSK